MHPILFEIGGFQIPSYGAFLVLAFAMALYLLRREAPAHGLDAEKIGDTAIMGLLFGLAGAKLLLILVDLPYYLEHPDRLLSTLRSAGVVYGGLIGGAAGMLWYMRRHRLPLWRTLDVMAPFAALGVGLGRMSCLMAGCCHGFRYDGPLHLVFPDHPLCEAPPGVGLFPVQPLDLLNGVALFFLLRHWLRHRYRFEGQIIIAFMFLYALTRGLIELLRGDTVRGIWLGGLSTSQLISIITLIAAIALHLKMSKQAH